MTYPLRFALLVVVVCALAAALAGWAEASTKTASRATLGPRAVRFARHLLGVPYSYGGTSPATGFDCSGFVSFVYRHFGLTLPRVAAEQFGVGRRVSRWALRPGDLVFFHGLGHVGLYAGGGRFIHAPHAGARVSFASLGDPWYSSGYDGARRP
jgi:cell wall-associated NlpC family hydrolase